MGPANQDFHQETGVHVPCETKGWCCCVVIATAVVLCFCNARYVMPILCLCRRSAVYLMVML